MFKQAFFAEASDLFFGGFDGDAERSGDGEIGLAVELRWQLVVEFLSDDGVADGGGCAVGGGELAEDIGGVPDEHLGHDERGVEVGVVADDDIGDRLAVHEAERSKNHGEAECDEAEATDGSHNIHAEHGGILLLDIAKEGIKLFLLCG